LTSNFDLDRYFSHPCRGNAPVEIKLFLPFPTLLRRCGGVIGRVTDLQFTGRCSSPGWAALCSGLGKLLKPVCLCHQAVKFYPANGVISLAGKVTKGSSEKYRQPTTGFMTSATCGLTA